MYLTEGFAMSIICINNHFFSTNLKYLISAFQSLWLTWTSVCLHSELYNCPKTFFFFFAVLTERNCACKACFETPAKLLATKVLWKGFPIEWRKTCSSDDYWTFFFTLQKLTTWKGLFTYRENKINRVMIFKRYVWIMNHDYIVPKSWRDTNLN